jgi:hypothetical protein
MQLDDDNNLLALKSTMAILTREENSSLLTYFLSTNYLQQVNLFGLLISQSQPNIASLAQRPTV